ncbi:hypothetical protein FH972_012522 [Carpinus fangiana]|uniref:Uncharacterized protein n=1 Tax=Carpinus fangiana TaxID=176857 RepID=A0A5N6R7D6_9ROSI|nr:hypothetical protein FH972_012522 [Carpinus fangiana]
MVEALRQESRLELLKVATLLHRKRGNEEGKLVTERKLGLGMGGVSFGSEKFRILVVFWERRQRLVEAICETRRETQYLDKM